MKSQHIHIWVCLLCVQGFSHHYILKTYRVFDLQACDPIQQLDQGMPFLAKEMLERTFDHVIYWLLHLLH